MNRIIFPLTANMRGAAVADLQDGLLLLLRKNVLQVSDSDRAAFQERLRPERNETTFGPTTRKLVSLFQGQSNFQATGEVDERTAAALNQALERLDAFSDRSLPNTAHIVGGLVTLKGRPYSEALVRAFHEDPRGNLRLGEDTTDAQGRYTIRYTVLPSVEIIRLSVAVYDSAGTFLSSSRTLDAAEALEVINLDIAGVERVSFAVNGKVRSTVSSSVGGLQVAVVDKTAGLPDAPLGQAAQTDVDGVYHVEFSGAQIKERGKDAPDLQARVLQGDKLLGTSEVRYNATEKETLNVLLDETAGSSLQSEHETLLNTLSRQFRGKLADLKETDDQQDITYLANKTGWDARAVAIASLADQFSAKSASQASPAIAPAFYYALFRAGLPANDTALYLADPKIVENVWKSAISQNLIPAKHKDDIPAALARYTDLASKQVLNNPPLLGLSSFKDVISVSLGNDEPKQIKLAALYMTFKDDPTTFWDQVRTGLGEGAQKRLQVDGRLAYLTFNNASLMTKLHSSAQNGAVTDVRNLVKEGYHSSEKWKQLIGNDPVPPEIPGKDDAEKRAFYAETLSAQMRLSFPTAVIADMVKSGKTPLTAAIGDQIHDFLDKHDDFEIGIHPVERFITRKQLQVEAKVVSEVKRIQRAYQLTPNHDSMNALLKSGVDSAYAIVRYDRDEFVRKFKNDVGGERNARLIHAKAQQVHSAVLNLAVSYITSSKAPGIGAPNLSQSVQPSPSGPDSEAANAADVIAYPTLEGLFGEMDFCACEHCQSILSPAAYLVDLLLFCDRPTNEKENPQSVLLERRPDIQHLPLTCENTNTPLPYIDVVNETLEYFVTHNLKLANGNEVYEGHSTGKDVTAEELLASPQFVSDTAYEILSGKTQGGQTPLLPPTPPLPLHQPLENLRRYFENFEAPLADVMEALRINDDMERANPNEYGRRDILMEELRLSRPEYSLLTDTSIGLKNLYGFLPATPDANVSSLLANAKNYAKRMGLSYTEVIELLQTSFINPNSNLIPKLEALGVPFSTIKLFKDGGMTNADFDAALAPQLDASNYGGDIKAWVKDENNYSRVMSLITLTNPADARDLCSFENFEFRYANPDNNANKIRPFEFVRMFRFIRVWKKLGWTIEQTDRTIAALYPQNQTPNDPNDAMNLQKLDAGFLILLPRLGVLKQIVKRLKLSLKKDLLPLLACFSPISTHGDTSLYRQMFLSRTILDQDPVFTDSEGDGEFLKDSTQKLPGHADALRAAFQITADEFNQIATTLKFDDDTALTLENISAIYRRGWLARKLKLSVREFLALTALTKIDPFDADVPALQLIDLVSRMRAVSLKPAAALYLFWNEDLSGRSAPAEDNIFNFIRTLRADFVTIDNEFAMAEDPDGQIAKSRMSIVYGSDATEAFWGLLDSKTISDVGYAHSEATLKQEILDAAPGSIVYDNLRKRLSYTTGVMPDNIHAALKAVAGTTQTFKDAIDELHKKTSAFFDHYPELLPIYKTFAASNQPIEMRRTDLLARFMPELSRRRKRQLALQAAGAESKTDLVFAAALLEDPDLLHAAEDKTISAMEDLVAIDSPGLSVQFYFRDTATGPIDLVRDSEPNLAYGRSSNNPLPAPAPATAISGIWSGFVEAPENGPYNLRIETDAGAVVNLTLDNATVPLTQNGNTWSNTTVLELQAGRIYSLALKVEKVKENLIVRWETTERRWEQLPPRYLYNSKQPDHLRQTYIRFFKAVSIASAFKLSAHELAHFASHDDYKISGDVWLNAIPVDANPDAGALKPLLTILSALLDFARMKQDISPDDEALLQILQDPAAATKNEDSLLYTLARWESDSLSSLLTRFGKTIADLTHLERFRQVYDAYGFAKKLGVQASALILAATNDPNATTVRNLQAALRARYEESDWLNVIKPINDQMRALQRDALVAYILHQMRSNPATEHIDTGDKLFEYFLMDVLMDPCMQTSRIRHALSSVQLFIERCLMNLEPRVAASSILAAQWEWMSRYRVWEANRKVFLYPENWLEPELRDDQSPIFKETIGELLQSDITEDRASIALLNYLSKLEEVAKLEPCGIHYAEYDHTKSEDDIAHVVARTAGANRKYFYRRREYGYWTPWEAIKLDIEDNPVIPVLWKDRLLLFWFKILRQSPASAPQISGNSFQNLKPFDVLSATAPKITIQAVLCWSEYYNGKWQPVRTSDVNKPVDLGKFGPNEFDRSSLQVFVSGHDSAALTIHVWSPNESGAFTLYNTHSLPDTDPSLGFYLPFESRYLDTSTKIFTVKYVKGSILGGIFGGKEPLRLPRPVLENSIIDRCVAPMHRLEETWDAPFFYEDGRHVFYVTTSERIVTLPEWNLYIPPATGFKPPIIDIPPIIVQKPPIDPRGPIEDPFDHILKTPGQGSIEVSPIEKFVSDNPNITRGIGSIGTVRFGDKDIGMRGGLIKGIQKR